jgi:hypothetical protein
MRGHAARRTDDNAVLPRSGSMRIYASRASCHKSTTPPRPARMAASSGAHHPPSAPRARNTRCHCRSAALVPELAAQPAPAVPAGRGISPRRPALHVVPSAPRPAPPGPQPRRQPRLGLGRRQVGARGLPPPAAHKPTASDAETGLNSSTRRPRNRAAAPRQRLHALPRPRITTGARRRNSGQSEPSAAASPPASPPPARSGPASAFSARSAATALLLPPPRPGPSGMRLRSVKCTPASQPASPRRRPAPPAARDSSVHRHRRIVAGELENPSPAPRPAVRRRTSSGATTDTKS